MAKLSDTQLVVLSKAAARDDGLATIPEGLNKAAAAKVVASLLSRKLMREVRSKPDMPAWRGDAAGAKRPDRKKGYQSPAGPNHSGLNRGIVPLRLI
jgi:hypothetical protein